MSVGLEPLCFESLEPWCIEVLSLGVWTEVHFEPRNQERDERKNRSQCKNESLIHTAMLCRPSKNAKLNDIDHSSLIHSAKEYVPQRLQNKVTSLRRRKNHNVDSRTLGGKRREKSKGFMPTSAAAALFYAGG